MRIPAFCCAVLCHVGFVLACGSAAIGGDEPSPQTAPAADPLLVQIDEVIETTKRRDLDGKVHTPWQIMHGILGMRRDYTIVVEGKKQNAIDWIREGATYQGEPYFQKAEFGARGHKFTKAGVFEGHPTQFLAYLSLSGVPADFTIKSGDETFTVADIINNAKLDLRSGHEVGWTLWALSAYLDSEATWTSKTGETWSIERLVRSQVYEPVLTGACGGTHGLFSLAFARDRRVQSGAPLHGIWLEADQKIRRHVEEAKALQNPDGSFSVDFFKGRRAGKTVNDRLGPCGHTMEFVVKAIPDSRLNEPWVRNGVGAVVRDLLESSAQPLEVAPLYHAIDGLRIYRERVRSLAEQKAGVAATGTSANPAAP